MEFRIINYEENNLFVWNLYWWFIWTESIVQLNLCLNTKFLQNFKNLKIACSQPVPGWPFQEAERLEPCDDGPGYSYVDYSEKRSLPISVPDYQCVDRAGQKYVAFNIYMAGRHLCSRRYREFSNLHAQLKKEFAGIGTEPSLTIIDHIDIFVCNKCNRT